MLRVHVVRRCVLVWAAALSLAAGCGSKAPQFATVTGAVTFNGGPLPPGGVESRVVFENKDGRAEMAPISTDGRYKAKVPLGSNRVRVDHSEAMIFPPKGGRVGMPMPGKNLIPNKYTNAATSGLKFDAEPGEHVYDIDLVGEPPK